MRRKLFAIIMLLSALVVSVGANARAQNKGAAKVQREVAVTFDDLPVVSAPRQDLTTFREITTKLLAAITAHRIPAIGFVNERKLYTDGKLDDAYVALLRQWTTARLELGNHTFSHPDLHRTALAEFQQNVIRGEEVTRSLLRERKRRLRYFRHPFLHTGTDLETKHKFEAFLKERGYRIAPVTIDNSEWIFAIAYAKAGARDDAEMMQRIGEAYLDYMDSKFDYFERQSIKLFGYEIKQILLLHANALNADYFDGVAQMMKRRGYKFITVDEALKDKAYTSQDTYVGHAGITWLHRWAMTRGTKGLILMDEPRTPAFVMKEAGVSQE